MTELTNDIKDMTAVLETFYKRKATSDESDQLKQQKGKKLYFCLPTE